MVDTPGFGQETEDEDELIKDIVEFLKPDNINDQTKIRQGVVQKNSVMQIH